MDQTNAELERLAGNVCRSDLGAKIFSEWANGASSPVMREVRSSTPRLRAYQLLNLLQTVLAGVFQVLLARRLGASSTVDAYFVAMAILTMAVNLGSFFCDTFLPLYHDLRIRDPRDAADFYRALLNHSLLGGAGLLVCTWLGGAWIVPLFAWGLAPPELISVGEILHVVSFALVSATATRLNNLLLNAELYFVLPYLVSMLGSVANLAALVGFGATHGIHAVAVATAASSVLGLAIQQLFIARRLGIRPGLFLWHPKFRELARTSFSVRLAHQIYMLKDLAITGFLSLFSPGAISLFNYTFRLGRVLFVIANSAALQIFSTMTARAIAEGRFREVWVAIRRLMLQNVASLSLLSLPLALLLPWILGPLLGPRIGGADLHRLWLLFVVTLPYHLILAAELPLVQTTIALKNGALMLRVAIRFLILYLGVVFLLRDVIGIYAVAAGLSVAQIWNARAYFRFVRATLNERVR